MTKFINFYAMVWFISILICMVLEGSYMGAHNTRNIMNYLTPFSTFNIGTIPIPVPNLNFLVGIQKILLWDYSFYYGGYEFLRYFWMAITAPGAIYAMYQAFVFVYANFLSRVFGLLP